MSFYAVDYRDGKLGVLDTSDKVTEYFTTAEIKKYLKDGIVINGVIFEPENKPMYTLDGLNVNLAYKRHKKVGKWIVVLLKEGDKWGASLGYTVKEDTLYFYDSSVKWSKNKYPFGQFVSSYNLKTILEHDYNYGLSLDASVDSWKVSKEELSEIVDWLWKVA